MKRLTLDDFLKQVYSKQYHSVWTATLGSNQAGKTDWNLYQMQRLEKLGLYQYFGANIPDLDTPFKYDFIEDFPMLKKRCQMLNPNPQAKGIKRYLFFGDEMGDWIPQDQPWLNVKLIKELQQVRKYGLNFLGSGISRIDKRVLNEKHFHGYFEKVGKKGKGKTRAIYYDWIGNRRIKLYDIPRTSITFNTFYSAMFYMEQRIQTQLDIPLTPEHKLVRQYLEKGSFEKAGIHRQEGKRAIIKVLDYHFRHCLHDTTPKPQASPVRHAVTDAS